MGKYENCTKFNARCKVEREMFEIAQEKGEREERSASFILRRWMQIGKKVEERRDAKKQK
jgi:hypothetical protein